MSISYKKLWKLNRTRLKEKRSATNVGCERCINYEARQE